MLNLFLVGLASLNIPSLQHSLPSKNHILCNILIRNWIVETLPTYWDSRWRPCWIFWKPDYWPMYRLAADFPSLYKIWCNNFDLRPNYGPKSKLKMAAASSWIYFRWLLLIYFLRCTTDINLHTKFHANISIHDWIIITYPSAILDFRKPYNWPMGRHWDVDCPSLYQIWCKNRDRRPNWSTWSTPEIQDGGRRHLEFIFGGYFWHITYFTLLLSTTIQNFVPIYQSTTEL